MPPRNECNSVQADYSYYLQEYARAFAAAGGSTQQTMNYAASGICLAGIRPATIRGGECRASTVTSPREVGPSTRRDDDRTSRGTSIERGCGNTTRPSSGPITACSTGTTRGSSARTTSRRSRRTSRSCAARSRARRCTRICWRSSASSGRRTGRRRTRARTEVSPEGSSRRTAAVEAAFAPTTAGSPCSTR